MNIPLKIIFKLFEKRVYRICLQKNTKQNHRYLDNFILKFHYLECKKRQTNKLILKSSNEWIICEHNEHKSWLHIKYECNILICILLVCLNIPLNIIFKLFEKRAYRICLQKNTKQNHRYLDNFILKFHYLECKKRQTNKLILKSSNEWIICEHNEHKSWLHIKYECNILICILLVCLNIPLNIIFKLFEKRAYRICLQKNTKQNHRYLDNFILKFHYLECKKRQTNKLILKSSNDWIICEHNEHKSWLHIKYECNILICILFGRGEVHA